jgi:hypothetical protein
MTATPPNPSAMAPFDLLHTHASTLMLAKGDRRAILSRLDDRDWSVATGTVAGTETIPTGPPQCIPWLSDALRVAGKWLDGAAA